MSLLAKFPVSASTTTREVHYGKLISYNGSTPCIVNGESKDKLHVIVQLEGEAHTRGFYPFKDSVYGLPTFIPKGGVDMSITLRESEPDADNKTYLNVISMGIKA